MNRLLGLHKIAAHRGDGLRPELMRLIEQSRATNADQKWSQRRFELIDSQSSIEAGPLYESFLAKP